MSSSLTTWNNKEIVLCEVHRKMNAHASMHRESIAYIVLEDEVENAFF